MENDVDEKQSVKKSSKKKHKKKSSLNEVRSRKDELDYQLMLTQLKQKLEEAKAQNDHAKAAELRNQVWVLTDMSQGVRTNISDEDLALILENVGKEIGVKMQTAAEEKKEGADAAPIVAGIQSNRMRNLQKKLDQIQALKERVEKGEKLESNQMEKIKSESSLREEMKQLTEILSSVKIKH